MSCIKDILHKKATSFILISLTKFNMVSGWYHPLTCPYYFSLAFVFCPYYFSLASSSGANSQSTLLYCSFPATSSGEL